MNSIDMINIAKLLRKLEFRVEQARGPNPELMQRLLEVRDALKGIDDIYPDDSNSAQNIEWVERLVRTFENIASTGLVKEETDQ